MKPLGYVVLLIFERIVVWSFVHDQNSGGEGMMVTDVRAANVLYRISFHSPE